MGRIMRDLRQVQAAGGMRQLAALSSESCEMVLRRSIVLLVASLLGSGVAVAVDLEKGKEINGTCAACHGDQGAGGKKGEYPRIAGQRVGYIESQLKNFRSRTRVNIPMFPYTQERELSDADIKDVSAYLAGIELSTKMPTFKGNRRCADPPADGGPRHDHSACRRQSRPRARRSTRSSARLSRQDRQGPGHVPDAGRTIYELPQAPGRSLPEGRPPARRGGARSAC
jgi:cytochrome c553